MNNWQFTWLVWSCVVLGSFAIIELSAVITHKDTFSECVVELTRHWPLVIGLYIMLVVGLAIHFWAPHAGGNYWQ